MITEIAILAGGLSVRLRPVTNNIPKSMIDINGKPFIAHQLGLFKNNGLKKAVICTGYLGSQIKDYINDGRDFGISVNYSYESEKLLGTGGAIKKALPLLGDVFFVVYGDAFLDINYRGVS